MLPRLIRQRDAPTYLGMDRGRFDADVRPQLVEIPIGVQGIAYDRLDLDAWADEYKARYGRAPREEAQCRPERAASKSMPKATERSTRELARNVFMSDSGDAARKKLSTDWRKSLSGNAALDLADELSEKLPSGT